MARSKRAATIALGLLEGKSPVEACIDAGMKRSTAEAHAWSILRRPDVKDFLVQYGISVTKSDLNNLAKARLSEALQDPDISAKELVPAIRCALEVSGDIGSRTVNVNHNIELPLVVQELLARKMLEISKRDGIALPMQTMKVIDVETEESSV